MREGRGASVTLFMQLPVSDSEKGFQSQTESLCLTGCELQATLPLTVLSALHVRGLVCAQSWSRKTVFWPWTPKLARVFRFGTPVSAGCADIDNNLFNAPRSAFGNP